VSIKATLAAEPLLVDVKMAAATLCVSRSTIYQLIWDGELEPVRIGRSVRLTPTQLEQFVSRRASGARAGDTSA
jgi:excisionase family DNA binding protein